MATETLETLIIRIGADVADLKKGVTDANKSLEGLDKTTKQTAAGMSTALSNSVNRVTNNLKAFAASFLSVAVAVKAFTGALNLTGDLDRLSQSTGISIQRLAELRQIAILTGTEFEVVARAVEQFGKRMTEQLAQPASLASQAVRALGLNVRDAQGNVRGLDDLLPELADRFSRLADSSNKTQLAIALFGEEAGPKLIPLLNRGAQGLDELRRRLGLTITPADIERAREYQRVQGELQITLGNLAQELTRVVGPGLLILAKALTEGLKSIPGLSRELTFNEEVLESHRQEVVREREALDFLNKEMDALLERHRQGGLSAEAMQRAQNTLTDRIDAQSLAVRAAERAWEQYLRRVGVASGPSKADPAAAGNAAPRLDPNALAQAQANLDQFLDRLQGSRLVTDELNLQWRTHAEIVAEAQRKITAALGEGVQARIALSKVEQNLLKQQQAQALQTATVAAQAITTLFPKSKAAAIAAATINTAVGITKAFTDLLPPWSWIQAGLIAAMGAAQISQIRSTTPTGGGGVTDPGSGGGASAAADPGGGQGGGGRVLSIQGLDPRALFTGAFLRDLIMDISNEVQNGVTMITTKSLPA